MKNAIEIKNLTVKFDSFKLDNISFSIPKGSILGIVGRNGAGKTTLINSIINTNDNYLGDIYIDSNAIYEDEVKYLKSFSVVPDTILFNPFLKAKVITKIVKKSFSEFRENYFDLNIKKLDVDLNKRFGRLSFGTQKKLMLVLMMSLNRDLLILDEPTAGIDPISKSDLLNLLQEYVLDESKTVILSTHETDGLDYIADYLLFLDKGKIKLFGDKEEIINSHYLVRLNKELITDKIKDNFIYIKEGSFGYTGLTKDYDLILDNNLEYTKPSIKDLMIGYVNMEEERNV